METCSNISTCRGLSQLKEYFILYTYVSGIGVGAVLEQEDANNKLLPVAYASRKGNEAVQDYSVTHYDALAVSWTSKHFRDIIYRYKVYVSTVNHHGAVTERFKGKN